MALLALALLVLYLALAIGVRTLRHRRSRGSSGFRGISGRPGSAEWTGGVLFVVAIVLVFAAPVLDLASVLAPVPWLDGPLGHALGLVLFSLGLVGTLAAQAAMGPSWRIGVDEAERTELVTMGPFAVVRNPIFAAMLPAVLGVALLVPNAVALAGFVALFVALELQVRLVEEPYLLRAHGDRYAEYAARTGHFVPGVGRLRRGYNKERQSYG
jgi:protein-S-isoprenylcysteine O-methyltransferase Ste14